ncbi:MAG: TRAFs-binding domain-containing protein [Cyclobacteriaceae bacterium]
MAKLLCFTVMPYGTKKDADGNEVDFNLVYQDFIKPAIEAADMEPIRADEETVNGIIHKPMYERLILSDYVVADLTTANANVFYELGIRHAVKPFTTITIFEKDAKLPFDVNYLRTIPYSYDYDQAGNLPNLEKDKESLTQQLTNTRTDRTTDSPVFQLVDGMTFQNSVAHEKTDIFRDRVKYNEELKNKLNQARKTEGSKSEKTNAVDAIVNTLKLENEEAGVLVDIMLSYRALGDYDKMVAFVEAMPVHVQQTVMVQEQKGFALNRLKRRDEAIAVLERVIEENGPSSETYGILGRVYKDLFDEARKEENEFKAEGFLDEALKTYLKGFEADWRDAYPGVNALTLLELKGDQESKEKLQKLSPVVEYAVNRKLETKTPDYWDYATLLEIAVIENDEEKAKAQLRKALTCNIEDWMFGTTLNNLNLIKVYRTKRAEDTSVPENVIQFISQQRNS